MKDKANIRVAGDKGFMRKHFGRIAVDHGMLWVGSWRDSDDHDGEGTGVCLDVPIDLGLAISYTNSKAPGLL